MKVLAGIDVPADLVCGSLLLARDIYAGMESRGDEVRFFTLRSENGAPLLQCEQLDVNKGAADDDSYVSRLRSAVKTTLGSWLPDVIHGHHLGYGMVQALTTLNLTAPCIGLAHGTDVFDARHDAAAKALASDIAGRCDAVIFPSLALVNEAYELGLRLRSESVVVLPWGLPEVTSMTARPPDQLPGTRLLVGSRLTANKDVATAIRAIGLLPDEVSLTVRGDGRERESLDALIHGLNVGGRVVILPPVPREELWSEMRHFTCAIFPTRETEAFGLFGLECQANGLPVVRSDLPVFAEILGASSASFRAGDAEDLARVIMRVVFDGDERERLSELGRVNARRYTMDRCVRDLRELSLTLSQSSVE